MQDFAIILLDSAGLVTGWNALAEEVTGYRADSALGRDFPELVSADASAKGAFRKFLKRAGTEGRAEAALPLRHREGRLFDAEAAATAQTGAEGVLMGFSLEIRIAGDSERRLRSEIRLFESMVESLPGILYMADAKGRFLRWNRNFERVSGYSAREIEGMHPLDFFRAEDKPRVERRIGEAFAIGEASIEARFLAKDGTATPYVLTGRRVFFEDSPCLVGVGIDISDRAKAQGELDLSERKYRDLVENANSIILRWNSDGIITLLNEYGLRFFGYAADEIFGRHVIGTIVPLSESGGRDLRGLMEEICADPKAFERNVNQNVRRDGERVWIAWTNKVALDSNGKVREILSIGTDITEQKRAEDARRESEARYRKIFEGAPDGMVIADPRSYYLDANPSICRMLGYTHAEFVGLHATDIVDPEETSNIDPALAAIKSSPDYHREWRFRRKDGSTFQAEVIATMLPDGNLLGMIRDISERKQAEAERDRRMRAESADHIKSAFLATMSHELRTPLNSIIGFTGILLQGLAGPLNPEQDKQLAMVRGSARHLLALVNDVLDISKIEAGQLQVAREHFDIRRSIGKVAELIGPQAGAKGLEVRLDLAACPETAVADPRRFEQILFNLLSNAIKFSDKGAITLSAMQAPGSMVGIRVIDTGIGIRPQDMPALFQPFRQIDSGLSRHHEGTGLGLAICRRLAELMGGTMTVTSEWGKGSTFTLTLPVKGTDEA